MSGATTDHALATAARRAAASVVDPEIPTLTIADMGILRDVTVEGGTAIVTITPTYSGCPAMTVIRRDIEAALARSGIDGRVRTALAPAWTTDWMTDDGRRKLEEGGIAPPGLPAEATCPRCRASDPTTVSEFGSTACKALMVCSACGEPFDLFKEL